LTYKLSDIRPANVKDPVFWASIFHYAIMNDVEIANRIIDEFDISSTWFPKLTEYEDFVVNELYELTFESLVDEGKVDKLLDAYNKYGIFDAAIAYIKDNEYSTFTLNKFATFSLMDPTKSLKENKTNKLPKRLPSIKNM